MERRSHAFHEQTRMKNIPHGCTKRRGASRRKGDLRTKAPRNGELNSSFSSSYPFASYVDSYFFVHVVC